MGSFLFTQLLKYRCKKKLKKKGEKEKKKKRKRQCKEEEKKTVLMGPFLLVKCHTILAYSKNISIGNFSRFLVNP